MVRPELLKKRIVAMVKERTWEADTESELTKTFRKLDTLAHNGEEYGYIEMDKMQRCASKRKRKTLLLVCALESFTCEPCPGANSGAAPGFCPRKAWRRWGRTRSLGSRTSPSTKPAPSCEL